MILLGLCCAAPSAGQEQYRLQEPGQWQKQAQPDPSTPEGQLHQIRKTLEQGRTDEVLTQRQAKAALTAVNAWIKRYPNHPMLVEAYMLRGDTLAIQREYYKALFDYERVSREYPASEQFNIALEREFEIAKLFGAGLKRRWLGMSILPAYDEAEEIFIRIQERAPGSELGEKASLALADFYYQQSRMTSAATAYDLFLVNYPRSAQREYAMLKLILANLATFKGPRFDATGLIDAGQRIRLYQREFPAAAERVGSEALLVRIDESLASKGLYAAQWYQRRNERISAIYLYQRVVRDHPRTAAAHEALQRLVSLKATAAAAAPPATKPAPPERVPLPTGRSRPGPATQPAPPVIQPESSK